jgi:hypothetical protein
LQKVIRATCFIAVDALPSLARRPLQEHRVAIRQEWGDPDNEGVPWESAEGGYQGNVIDSWDLFSEELELGISNENLFQDLYNSRPTAQAGHASFSSKASQPANGAISTIYPWTNGSTSTSKQAKPTTHSRRSRSSSND